MNFYLIELILTLIFFHKLFEIISSLLKSLNIVCFHLENGAIEVGDVVVMLPTDANFPARRGNAISLRVGTASLNRVVGGPDCHFGVKLPYNPSPTASYAILHSEIVGGLDL